MFSGNFTDTDLQSAGRANYLVAVVKVLIRFVLCLSYLITDTVVVSSKIYL